MTQSASNVVRGKRKLDPNPNPRQTTIGDSKNQSYVCALSRQTAYVLRQ